MTPDERRGLVASQYAAHVNPGLARLMNFAGFGVEESAEGCWITDHEGRRFLDCLGGYGVFSLGHRHPGVIAAVQDQLGRMPLGSKVFFNEMQSRLAARLASLAPGDLKYAFFCNSGAEAVEAALKLARSATGRPGFVSTIGSYHGKTMGALAVTGREKYRRPFEPLAPGASFVDFNDLAALDRAVTDQTAAVILEPVQGEGGIHLGTEEFLRGAQDICRERGALFILDEVQTGLGRTGRMFAADHFGLEPDLMPLAKALGGGVMPIGACLGTTKVWEKVFGENPLIHTSTFGGNSLACAAGLAAIEATESENLCRLSEEMGARLMAGLRSIESDLLADVRGLGLMIGVEFAMDEVGELVIGQMTKRGVVAAYTLNNPRVIRFEPPLIISDAEVDLAVQAFAESVQETSEMLAGLL